MRYELIPVRMDITKDNTQEVLARDVEKENSHALLVECKLVQPIWKAVCRLLQKIKKRTTYDPAV